MSEQPPTRVLVIEDEAPIRERMVRILKYEGYETRGAESGLAGVSITHAFRPDVILCDVMMSEGDGFEALAMLRQHLDTETIPIIFVSAATDRASIRQAMEEGADDYITKPFSTEELVGAIEAQLRKRAALLRRPGD
jgi:DNA-binding response OmpR family regulator